MAEEIDIEIDPEFSKREDYIVGRPTVFVDLWVNGNQTRTGERALVDMGSNRTVFSLAAVWGERPTGRVVTVNSADGSRNSDTYPAQLTINGLVEDVHEFEAAIRSDIPYMVLLGRDVLQHYRMICDPTIGEFKLIKP